MRWLLIFGGRHLPLLLLSLAPLSLLSGQEVGPSFPVPSCEGCAWFMGNTHTHTLESDGDSSPEAVARWYRDHGYDFLVLSDHNVLYDPGGLVHLVDSTFLLIPGEEVTSSFQGKPVHLNALNLHTLVEPRREETLVGTLQANVDAIRAEKGIPHISMPYWNSASAPASRCSPTSTTPISAGSSVPRSWPGWRTSAFWRSSTGILPSTTWGAEGTLGWRRSGTFS